MVKDGGASFNSLHFSSIFWPELNIVMSSSKFSDVATAPMIEVFAVADAYNEDKHPQKVSLGIGAYRTEEGKPWVLPVVKKAEQAIVADTSLNHEYLPITGLPEFIASAAELLLGHNSPAIKERRVSGVQALGGTGAIFIGAAFLRRNLGATNWYISTPTWENHSGVAKHLGYEVCQYRYWDQENRSLNFSGMMEDLSKASAGSVIVLHACAHNPTGVDLSRDQWKQVAHLVKEKHLFPYFDIAYQGFATGDVDNDAWAVRYFVEEGFEMFIAQSFSKNFGLYNERVGCLTFVVNDARLIPTMIGQFKVIVRTSWSNPPAHGARVVSHVAKSPELYAEWLGNVKMMADRIMSMRQALYAILVELGTPGKWDHITSQIGMFSYTGLNPAQVKLLRDKHHIYLLSSGRVSMCGINTKNVRYVAQAIDDAVRHVK